MFPSPEPELTHILVVADPHRSKPCLRDRDGHLFEISEDRPS